MAPIRIVFFALALMGVFVSIWVLQRTAEMYEYHDENLVRAEEDKKTLQSFKFDESGNVPEDETVEFQLTLVRVKMSAESIAHSKEQVGIGRTWSSIAIGTTLLFAVLGLVVGRKKKPSAPAHQPKST